MAARARARDKNQHKISKNEKLQKILRSQDWGQVSIRFKKVNRSELKNINIEGIIEAENWILRSQKRKKGLKYSSAKEDSCRI